MKKAKRRSKQAFSIQILGNTSRVSSIGTTTRAFEELGVDADVGEGFDVVSLKCYVNYCEQPIAVEILFMLVKRSRKVARSPLS